MQFSKLIDRLFLFSLVGELEKIRPSSSDQFHLIKIPFLFRMSSQWESFPAFNYSFYRHTWGPFTTEIYDDRNILEWSRLIERKHEKNERLTEKGKVIFGKLQEAQIFQSQPVVEMQKLTRRMAKRGFGDLKKYVYDMKVVPEQLGGGKIAIRDIPMGTTIFYKHPDINNDLFLEHLDKELLLDFMANLVFSRKEYVEINTLSSLPIHEIKKRLKRRSVNPKKHKVKAV